MNNNSKPMIYRSKGDLRYSVTVVDFGNKEVKYHMGQDPDTIYIRPVADFLSLYR